MKRRTYEIVTIEYETPDDEDGTEIGTLMLTAEQMRIAIVAIAGFELDAGERATIKPVYMPLMRDWRADPAAKP